MSHKIRTDVKRKIAGLINTAESGIDCVFLTCFDFEFQFLATLLCYANIRMHRAETVEQADFLLTVTSGTVLLTDIVFLDGSWQNAVDMLADVHPLAATVIVADPVDRDFVSEARNRGACAVLWKPFQLEQVRRVIRAAHEATVERVAKQCLAFCG